MNVTFRPIPIWPHPETPAHRRRGRATFKAPWPNTMDLLGRELGHLRATGVILGANFREQDLRLDGLPRSNARAPLHPGIEISFDTRDYGRLVYATDSCERWEHNVRSVALGLEALRAVDRFGITRRGEQYAGWKQLGAGDLGDVALGHELITLHGGITAALRATHPDISGYDSADDFRAVQAAREVNA